MKKCFKAKRTKKVITLEKLVIRKMNGAYYKLSSEDRDTLKEMSKCKEMWEEIIDQKSKKVL